MPQETLQAHEKICFVFMFMLIIHLICGCTWRHFVLQYRHYHQTQDSKLKPDVKEMQICATKLAVREAYQVSYEDPQAL